VNDTFFYGSTGTIVSSLVTMSTQVLYQLGNLDYKIRSVTGGTEYMTCDSTLGNTNISNLSVDNLSTNLLNNISAGENITLSTEAGTNKLVITAIGSSNLSLDNLSVTNQLTCGNNISTPKLYVNDTFFYGSTGTIVSSLVTMSTQVLYQLGNLDYKIRSVTGGIEYMTCDSTLGNTNISNLSVDNLSCVNISTDLLNNLSAGERITLTTEAGTNKIVITASGELNSSNLSLDNLSVDNVSSVELSLSILRLKDNTQTTRGSWFVYPTATEIYTQNDFRIRNQGLAGSPNFMVMDTSSNNVNISNLSVSNFDVEFVDLTNNLSDGKGINITSSGGKAVISLQDPMNISTITAENMNVSGSAANFFDGANIYGTATVSNLVSDLTNTLSAGANITITSVGGKAQISSTGGGGSVPANLSIDNLSVNFDATIGGDLKMLSADIIATSSELFILDVTCTGNMSVANTFGANSIAASSTLTVGTNATVTGNITASVGDITATTGNINGNNLSVFNDASVGVDLSVGNKTITTRVQYNPSSLFWQVSANGPQPGASITQLINFDLAIWDKSGGAFGRTGAGFLVNISGWYKCSAHVQFRKISGTNTQTIRSFFTINGVWLPTRGATLSSSPFLNGNARFGNSSLTNTIFFEAGEEVTVAYQAANQPGANFGGAISSVVTVPQSYIYMEYLGGTFNF
jgi:lactam utilization protein B